MTSWSYGFSKHVSLAILAGGHDPISQNSSHHQYSHILLNIQLNLPLSVHIRAGIQLSHYQIQVNPKIQTLSNPKQLPAWKTLGTSKGSSVFGNNVIASQ